MARRQRSDRKNSGESAHPELLAGESLPPAPQQARSRRTREALLAAALESFEQHGFDATTIEAIALRAKVAVGAFYVHFRTKRQLLLVLMDRLLSELAELEPPAGFTLDAEGAKVLVATLVRTGLRVDMKYLGAYRAWQEAVLRDPALAEQQRAIESWTMQRVAALLVLVSAAPNARRDVDSVTLARILNTLFWRLMQLRAGDEEAVLRTTIGIVVHAIFMDE